VVYPEKISTAQYPSTRAVEPQTGQLVITPHPEYERARDEAKQVAKKSGHWLEEEMKKQDLLDKLALMILLTCKHSVSYMQVWPDAVEEAIRTQVFDAFDIVLMGDLTKMKDQPFVIKETPQLISVIKANENFDPEELRKIHPDNKMASSEIKEAYMKSRYGGNRPSDHAATLIQKESFLKEYVSDKNIGKIRAQEDGERILKNRDKGDPIIRQVFTAGGVTLRDSYLNLHEYPLVDFRLEPGPMYQVPLIERFISQNKSLNMVISRLERYTHTMVAGTWLKRRGENFKINNAAGGQIIEYDQRPPEQGQVAPLPAFLFNYIELLTSFIEEQGVTTTTLGKIPKGVKAHAAIESLKESEFANLVIAQSRLRKTVQKVSERFLDIADENFVTPQTVYYLEKGEPNYFDIIGDTALKGRKKLKVETPEEAVPIRKDYRVEIEIQAGMGFTRQGQKESVQRMVETMLQYAEAGLISPQAIKVVLERWLEVYQFGTISEFMEALESGDGGMQEAQLQAIKVAVMEVMKDLQGAGVLATSDQRVQETKVGVAEVAKDLGGGEVNA
jgi:hypothetical protein